MTLGGIAVQVANAREGQRCEEGARISRNPTRSNGVFIRWRRVSKHCGSIGSGGRLLGSRLRGNWVQALQKSAFSHGLLIRWSAVRIRPGEPQIRHLRGVRFSNPLSLKAPLRDSNQTPNAPHSSASGAALPGALHCPPTTLPPCRRSRRYGLPIAFTRRPTRAKPGPHRVTVHPYSSRIIAPCQCIFEGAFA